MYHVVVRRLARLVRRFKQGAAPAPSQHRTGYLYGGYYKTLPLHKRKQLNMLCEQLLRNQELLVSGKVQFIGLKQVKKRLGSRWRSLSNLIYQVTEESILAHINKDTDIFFQYAEDVYIMLFTCDDVTSSGQKTTAIAADIQQRLFELDEKDLRRLEMHDAISTLNIMDMMNLTFGDFLESFSDDEESGDTPAISIPARQERVVLPDNGCTQVNAGDYHTSHSYRLSQVPLPGTISYHYMPLWDVRRNALNTFLCLASARTELHNPFAGHLCLYRDQPDDIQGALDMAVLRTVIEQLRAINHHNGGYLVACPVQHATLHKWAFFTEYRAMLETIPEHLRGHFVLYVMDGNDTLPVADAYWFSCSLKRFCRYVFAEVPVRQDVNFSYLKKLHVDAVGVRLTEPGTHNMPNARMLYLLQGRAKALGVPMTFMFNVGTLENINSDLLVQYDYVSGKAIGKVMRTPAMPRKFTRKDLMLTQGSADVIRQRRP